MDRMKVMTMPPLVTLGQRQGREFAKREIVRFVEHGMTATQARKHCPVPMHRTTVYRLLKRVEREGEQALTERRHGHPVKLREEVLTFVLDYCQNHASAASREVQRLVAERFSLSVSVSQLNRVRAAQGLSRKAPKLRKKSRKRISLLPLDLMNRRVACSCWQQSPRPACSRSWSKHCRSLQPHQSHHAFLWQRVQQSADACYSRSSFWERLVYNARGICAAILPMAWRCLLDGCAPMATATPKPFCRR